MVIQLSDYSRCLECGGTIKANHTEEADIYDCRCGMTTFYFPDLDWRVITDEPDYLTVGEWREVALDEMIEFTPSRWMYLRMAWRNFVKFIKGG